MSRTASIVLVSLGGIGGLLLYFQNVIFGTTLITPMGRYSASMVILVAVVLGVMIGFWIAGLMSAGGSDRNDDDEGF